MLRELNPFAPGADRRPPELVGRDGELTAFDTIVARTRNQLGSRAMVLSGLRGVGKTVLLNAMRDRAEKAGWLVVSLEAQRSDQADAAVRRRLVRELVVAARRLNPPSRGARLRAALGSIESFKVQVGVTGISLDVEPSTGRADSGDLETDLGELVEDLAEALAEEGLGFGLFIDEMQDLSTSTLASVLTAQHAAGQDGHRRHSVRYPDGMRGGRPPTGCPHGSSAGEGGGPGQRPLGAGPVNAGPVLDVEGEDDAPVIVDINDHPVVPDPVAPQAAQAAGQGFSSLARIIERLNLTEIGGDPRPCGSVQPLELLGRVWVKLNRPGQRSRATSSSVTVCTSPRRTSLARASTSYSHSTRSSPVTISSRR
jgi:AAA ATPase domain